MSLLASPYVGERTNEELQDWIKALQDQCARMTKMIEIFERVDKNNEVIIETQSAIIEGKKDLLNIRDQQIKLLESVIDRYERGPINRSSLTAFSSN